MGDQFDYHQGNRQAAASSDQFDYHQGDRQVSLPNAAEPQQSPFLDYQMPGYRPSSANQPPQEFAMRPPAPYYDPNYRPAQAVSLIDRDGQPVQGSRADSSQALQSQRMRADYPQVLQSQGMRADFPQVLQSQGMRDFPQVLPPIDPAMLAREQASGHLSRDMIYACNSIWDNTRNPQEVNHLLQDVNKNLEIMGSPIRFGSTFEPLPPGAPYGMLPKMSIILEDLRDAQHTNRIFLK